MAHVPMRYAETDRSEWKCGDARMIDVSDDVFYDWLLYGSRLVTVVGKGKTRFATAVMVEAIVRRYYTLVDELRFRYVSAPAAFEELSRTRFDPDTNFDNVVRYAGMLVIDDLHALDDKDMRKAIWIIAARCDNALSTVITLTAEALARLSKEFPGLRARVGDGLMISL